MLKVVTKNGKIQTLPTTLRAGCRRYAILFRGYLTQDYDVTPYALVTLTPGRAAEVLSTMDALHRIPEATKIVRCNFLDDDALWFTTTPDDPEISEAMDAIEPVVLSALQAKRLADALEENPGFRPGSSTVDYTVEAQHSLAEFEYVRWITTERHVDIDIFTREVYRLDLERIAGKLYKRPEDKKRKIRTRR